MRSKVTVCMIWLLLYRIIFAKESKGYEGNRSIMTKNFFIPVFLLFLTVFLHALPASAQDIYVATDGSNSNPGTLSAPWKDMQYAVGHVGPGQTIYVRGGTYSELVSFRGAQDSGSENGGHITLQNYPGESPVIDGNNLSPTRVRQGLISIVDASYVKIIGFELRNFRAGKEYEPMGMHITGHSHHLEIRNNLIHHIEQTSNDEDGGGNGIAVFGTDANSAVHDLLFDGNEVRDCRLGYSEALVLNGNVGDFVVSNNSVHDCNNIAYDFIGFEGECGDCSGTTGINVDRARNGLVFNNIAYNIDTSGNPAYGNERLAAGFYVDGGADIILERNIVHDCNFGFELASEHHRKATERITVRNNFIYNNHILGITTGGYSSGTGPGGGEAKDIFIVNNTFYKNTRSDVADDLWGAEIVLQNRNNNNVFKNNIVYARSSRPIVDIQGSFNQNNVFGNQLYFGSSGNMPGAVSTSDPLLIGPEQGNLHIQDNSPTIDSGENLPESIVGTDDFDGNPRLVGSTIDIGAHEFGTLTSIEFSNQDQLLTFELYQNYPNPFNPATTIQFAVPKRSQVTLTLFDLLGREVATLVDEELQPGEFKVMFDASGLASGVYLYRLKAEGFVRTRKLTLLK